MTVRRTSTARRNRTLSFTLSCISVLALAGVAVATIGYTELRSNQATIAYGDGYYCGEKRLGCKAFCLHLYEDDPPLNRACDNGAQDGRSQPREGNP